MEDDIVLNIDFEGLSDPSIQVVPSNIAWEDLELLLKVFSDQKTIIVNYIDEDNDEITIDCQEELLEAFKVARKFNNTIRVKVYNSRESLLKSAEERTEEVQVLNYKLPVVTVKTKSKQDPLVAVAEIIGKEKNEEATSTQAESTDPQTTGATAMDVDEKEPASQNGKESHGKKLYVLKLKATGYVIDVRGAKKTPGTDVILWPRHTNPNPNQLWYEDKKTGTIRSALNDLCLEASEYGAKMMPFDPSKTSQQWTMGENRIQHRYNPNYVVMACPGMPKRGHVLTAGNFTGDPHQIWVAKEKKPKPESPKRASPAKTDTTKSGTVASSPPPAWFTSYMEKHDHELAQKVSTQISQQVTNQILKGLEGAVITSMYGSSGIPAPAPGGTSGQSSADKPKYCHYGVVCDVCENTIVGVRYKCGNCEDYDLCEDCEALGNVHNGDHVFLKIQVPVLTAGRKRNGKMTPLLKRNLYQMDEEAVMKEQDKTVKREEKLRRKCEKLDQKLQQQLQKQEEGAGSAVKIEKIKSKEEKLKRRLEQIKDHPVKKEKLDLPQFKQSERMGAEFLRDETIPDGTHVQPGTKLVKRWVVKNNGTHAWNTGTTLKMMWGTLAPLVPEIAVPPLEVGEEGIVSVELVAPQEPGSYQSHWRMSHNGVRFGHRMWCVINVDEKEMLETKESSIKLNVVQTDDEKLVEKVAEIAIEPAVPDIATDGENTEEIKEVSAKKASAEALATTEESPLMAQDILSFEMLEIHDRHRPKVSQTATPNNTPMGMTPPKSPIPEEDETLVARGMSSSSSVELVPEVSPDADSDAAALMTQLVHERMASLGLRPLTPDIESLSSTSEDSDTDSDFYIVPIPDCFNPGLPARKEATQSVCVKKEDVEEMQDALDSQECEPLLASHRSQEDSGIIPVTITPPAGTTDQNGNKEDEDHDDEQEIFVDTLTEEPEPRETTQVTQSDETPEVDGEREEHAENPTEQTEGTEDEAAGGDDQSAERHEAHSPSALASTVISAAVCAASQAYSTAKDVFHTLQAKNQYQPTQQNWTPPEHPEWSPPPTWTPVETDYTPPENTWVGPPPPIPPRRTEDSPMRKLVEMGFADRAVNKELLEKHNDDVEKVVQELVSLSGSHWAETRH